MKYVCLLTLLGLIACAPTPDDAFDDVSVSEDTGTINDPSDIANEECDASDYRALIGTPVTATVFQTGDRLRVFSEADIVTQEYIPQRTNVEFNTGGKIVRVFCG